MTIRLRCAECQRKLKVPDEALGKKVQCPACGARFIGRLEPTPPPAKPQNGAALDDIPLASPVDVSEPPPIATPPHTSATDDLFAELGAAFPLSVEETPARKEPAEPNRANSLLPNLELDHSPEEVGEAEIEPLEPEEVIEDAEPIAVEDGVSEIAEEAAAVEELPELPMEEVIEEAFEEETWTAPPSGKGKKPSPSDFDDIEEVEEEEADGGRSKNAKRKKSGKGLVLVIVAVLCLLLGGGGAAAYFAYQWFLGGTPTTAGTVKPAK